MISHLMLGTNDLEKAIKFYDDLLSELGATRAYNTDRLAAWSFGDRKTMLAVTRPHDEKSATTGNGTMVALSVENSEKVNAVHAKALELGGRNEGDPGLRGKSFYGAYFRDLDGNKLNLFCYQ